MIKLVTVKFRGTVESPTGRQNYAIDSSSFRECDGYTILEDRVNRLVFITKGEKVVSVPFESTIRMEYASLEDAGITEHRELVTEKGDVPGEMTITLEPKRGPGRPRKYPLSDDV